MWSDCWFVDKVLKLLMSSILDASHHTVSANTAKIAW